MEYEKLAAPLPSHRVLLKSVFRGAPTEIVANEFIVGIGDRILCDIAGPNNL